MDVAFGATNVSVSRKFISKLSQWFLGFFLFLLTQASFVFSLTENQPIHFSGDKQIWDRKANRVELIGHGAVNQANETLTGDYILLDLKSRILDARGNCVYIASDSVIWGDEMHFNLDTRTGTVVGGRVSNEFFTLRGERINKLGPGRFQTHWGDYSTCRDCAASWTIEAEDVDMQLDGYGYLSNVTTLVKDVPAFWLPYLVIPVKSRRQTGFIFPPFRFSGNNGAQFVLPFFWAINRSADITLGAGVYTQRGKRIEGEGRYALSPRSNGIAKLYYVSDRNFAVPNRWALNASQTQELPFHIEEKLRLNELSDNIYPLDFPDDIPSIYGEAFAPSSLTFSRSASDVSAFIALQRYRNIVNSTPDNTLAQQTQFDNRTVQAFPNALLTVNDRFLGGTPFLGGLTLGFTNFTRGAGAFDYDNSSVPFGTPIPIPAPPFRPGIDPIREATRLSITPTVYTTFRPFDVFSVVPSLQYHQFVYNFGNQVPGLYRGYLLFQTDLSTQIERIYEFPDDPGMPRAKHLIRPTLTYSYIPYIREPDHPFINQINNSQMNNISGYNFDDNDIVPYTYTQSSANYFVPLGNSLAYGFTTQWIRRKGAEGVEAPSYQNTVEFSAGQALNFREITNPVDPSDPHIFTRLYSILNLNLDRLISSTNYYYYPDVFPSTSRHTLSTNATYIIERGARQRILTYDRSITLGYAYNKINGITSSMNGLLNFSISDYLMPFGTISYAFEPIGQLLGAGFGAVLQSPSQCWKLTAGVNYSVTTGTSYTFDLSLNLTGAGFGGVTEIANKAQAQTL